MTSFVDLNSSHVPPHLAAHHAAFLATAQQSDGGFPGRRGPSDLYYTGFALRGLALLSKLNAETAARAGEFLRSRIAQPLLGDCPDFRGHHAQRGSEKGPVPFDTLPAADFVSLLTSSLLVELATGRNVFAEAGRDRRQAAADFFARLRRDDGGYAKTQRGTSSTYQTFLVVLCRQLVGLEIEDRQRLIATIRDRQRPDGGFVEAAAVRASGTNPTAAAVEVLRALEALDAPTADAATRFLAARQTAEGGLQANTQMPVVDLLSTFTGLYALAGLGCLAAVDLAAAHRFALAQQSPDGGFRAGTWDTTADVEYTFYGLGTLVLTASGKGNACEGEPPMHAEERG